MRIPSRKDLVRLRQLKGMSQLELAVASGWKARGYVSNLEAGDQLDNRSKLAEDSQGPERSRGRLFVCPAIRSGGLKDTASKKPVAGTTASKSSPAVSGNPGNIDEFDAAQLLKLRRSAA
jgi:hypothetical protein